MNRFKLPADVIDSGLPLIDTRNTEISGFCPAPYQGARCDAERFRTLDGSCNNLEVSNRGAALSAMRRLIPNDYADGNKNKLNSL